MQPIGSIFFKQNTNMYPLVLLTIVPTLPPSILILAMATTFSSRGHSTVLLSNMGSWPICQIPEAIIGKVIEGQSLKLFIASNMDVYILRIWMPQC